MGTETTTRDTRGGNVIDLASMRGYAVNEVRKTSATTGLCAGTLVMTMDGELPVEHLSAGDRVITRDSGMAILSEVRVFDAEITPIRVKAGSLGHTRPEKDMLVPPDAQLHIRDWRAEAMFGQPSALVPARRLIDGEFVYEGECERHRVFELVFDTPHILYAGGLEVVSVKA